MANNNLLKQRCFLIGAYHYYAFSVFQSFKIEAIV